MSRIHSIAAPDRVWPFDGSASAAYWTHRPKLGYARNFTVDPFPCYSHELELVERLVAAVETAWPVEFPPDWYVLAHECLSRTQGFAFRGEHYERPNRRDGDPFDLAPAIVLCGKRTPIHPAVTRYLVAHEYGHVVHYHMAREAGVDKEEFLKTYAQMRGIEYSDGCGGGRWHANTGEIFANDFRVVGGWEVDFWPHFEVPRPNEAVRTWWASRRISP